MTHENDAELMARWQGGDVSAFEELVCRWQTPISRFLSHYAGNGHLVEDMCQDVFLRLYLNGRRYRCTGAFSTWLYRIALNIARDSARRQKRRQALNHKPPAETTTTAADHFEQREIGTAVAEALAKLPEALRLAVVLRHYESMSFADMSRLLSTPESTLKSRFAAALQRLRAVLEEKGWSLEENNT